MRIVAGVWRGRSLIAPPGQTTRPTADRVRQALFDMLMHAPWGGSAVISDAIVLDGFAGTGALGLEALSRGAACNAIDRTRVLATDILNSGPGQAATLIFLDPPYGNDLVPRALDHLRQAGRVADDALVVAELRRDETWIPPEKVLAERTLGPARIVVFRVGTGSSGR